MGNNDSPTPPRSKENSILDDTAVITPTHSTSQLDGMVNAPWKVKSTVLLCMLVLPVGCHFMESTMGTLKTSLKSTMHINNTQFGILMSSVTLVNTMLPLLAGAFVDDINGFGSVRATTFVSFMILSGSLVVSLAATHNNYPAMVAGQMIYGLGGGMMVTMQEAIVSKWFRNQQLTIVIGLVLCLARLVNWVAKMICYPIINATQNTNTPIYIATIICALGFAMNGVYWYIMYRYGWATGTGKELTSPANPNSHLYHHQQEEGNPLFDHIKTTSFMHSVRLILRWLPYLPCTFWMIPWLQLVMSSVLSSFEDVATEYVQFRFQTTTVMAGYQSSLTQVVPIVVAPVMGILIHRYGYRITSLLVGTFFLILSMVLMGYTEALPAIGMILFSCALAFGPVSILSASSLLLPHELVGIGTGLHKCANNIGTTVVAVLVGYVQDLTFHDGDAADNNYDLTNEYDGVMIFYLTLACGATLLTCCLWWMDRQQLSGWLQVGKKERDRRIEDASDLKAIGSQLRGTKTYTYVGIYCFWLVAAWIVFFVFALMPVYMNYE
ncbi:major facilitator superfamily domain-containing protein [Chlamydoabsidia padenii]|nr:major facilitator superfamily domain-containing protein [Chlamydoabsidia padenii]